ncbi:MAG: hypothetical protein AUH85_15670 [Chloroflexi bacterium 13_1_40CM_4_68_4]|nr:MAG: hypothetical protein AUH85_15670 [Chloroflexi bacterium 13_1_40CM_4_68_4]
MGCVVALNWSYGERVVSLRLPFGASSMVPTDASVQAGNIVARGTHYRATRRVDAAKALASSPETVRGLLRVRVGDAVREGTIVARSGQRFARAIVAAQDGRLVHLDAAGGVHLGTIRAEWTAQAPIDGLVRRADPDRIVITGPAWTLAGLAAFGPSRAGVLSRAVERPVDDLSPSGLDVAASGRIAFGAARAGGEALTRAHAVGVAGVVCASISFRALVPIYGDDVSAFGSPSWDDAPTILVTRAFGRATFDREIFARLSALEGARAAIDTTTASLHVFAPPEASEPAEWRDLMLEEDLSGERADGL